MIIITLNIGITIILCIMFMLIKYYSFIDLISTAYKTCHENIYCFNCE